MNRTLFDIDNWREIAATLSRNRTRTFLTAFGIFWGTAILAICWGGGQGTQGMMKRNFEGFATNLGGASAQMTSKSYMGYNYGRYWDIDRRDLDRIITSIPEIEHITGMLLAPSTAKYSTKSYGTSAMGVNSDYWKLMEAKLYGGRILNSSDDAKAAKYCVIGKTVASQLFGESGIDPLGKQVEVDGVYYTVVGVAGQYSDATMGVRLDEAVVIPQSTFQRTYNTGNRVGDLLFTTRKGTTPSDIQPQLESILRRNHFIAPDDERAIHYMDISEMFKMVDNVFLGIDLLMIFVGLGTLLAGVIGVGNIMWIIVKERTKEIGIRRAIGAKPSDIITQILSESMTLTAIAGLAGIVFAVIILAVLDKINHDPWLGSPGFELSLTHGLAILAAFMVLGTAAGIIPALKSMKIKPIEAMNDK